MSDSSSRTDATFVSSMPVTRHHHPPARRSAVLWRSTRPNQLATSAVCAKTLPHAAPSTRLKIGPSDDAPALVSPPVAEAAPPACSPVAEAPFTSTLKSSACS
eukprot:6212352-Pleurochrysis_carterae.AAC.4